MEPTLVESQQQQVFGETLTAHDRCDSCGAQAYVRATFEGGDLLFCGHHFKKSEDMIILASKTLVDERFRLDP